MKQNKFIEVFLIFLFSFPPVIWLFDGSIILGHDSGFRIKYTEYLYDLFYSWNPYVGFGADLSINKGFLITQLPETLLMLLFSNMNLGQLVTLVFWFFMIGLSMYILTWSLFPQKQYWPVRMFSSLLYMYNFFVLQGWFIAERAKFSLIIALPIMVIILWNVLNKKWSIVKGGVLCGLLFFLFNGGGSPPLYGPVLLVFAITFFIISIFTIAKFGKSGFVYCLKALGSIAFFSILLNSYWIFPQVYLAVTSYRLTLVGQGGVEGVLAWEAVVTKFASMTNLLRLQGIPDWYENPIHPYAGAYIHNPIFVIFSFLPFLVITGGLFLYSSLDKKLRSDRLVFLFLLMVVVGLLFTAGSHPPFGVIYKQLLLHVPGFAIFRSAFYKFGPVLWFSVSFLFGYMSFVLLRFFNKRRSIKLVILSMTMVYFVLFSLPFLNPKFFNWHQDFTTRVSVPDYVYQMNHFINTNTPSDARILLLPGVVAGADQYTWGFWSLDSLPRLSLNRSVVSNDMTVKNLEELYQAFYSEKYELVADVLSLLHIDSILVRNDVYEPGTEQLSYTAYVHGLTEDSGSQHTTFGKWEYYPLSDTYPVFSLPKKLYSLNDGTTLTSAVSAIDVASESAFVTTSDTSSAFDTLFEKTIVNATCIICGRKDYDDIEKGVHIPNPQILPDSPFYSVIRDSRTNALQDSLSPSQKIDRELSYSTLMLSEMNKLFGRELDDGITTYINNNIKEYIRSIEVIESNISKLSIREKEVYLPRVIAYIRVQQRFVKSFTTGHRFTVNEYNRLLLAQSDVLERLTQVYDVSSDLKHFVISVDAGTYELLAPDLSIEDVQLNGEDVLDTSSLRLPKGEHILTLRTDPTENFLDDTGFQKSVDLSYGEEQTVSLDIDKTQAYVFEVSVTDIKGVDPQIIFTEYSKNSKTPLRTDKRELTKIHNSFVYEYFPHPLASRIQIDFTFDGYTYESSSFTIDTFNLSYLTSDAVFLQKTRDTADIKKPIITKVRKWDPTMYTAHISQASSPFLFAFHQAFHPGWELYVVDDPENGLVSFMKTIFFGTPVENHVVVNTYMNGWFIDKSGSYSLLLFYKPQVFFYIGLVSSAVVLIGIGIITIVFYRRKRSE